MKGAGWQRVIPCFKSRSWRLKIDFPMWYATARRFGHGGRGEEPQMGHCHTH